MRSPLCLRLKDWHSALHCHTRRIYRSRTNGLLDDAHVQAGRAHSFQGFGTFHADLVLAALVDGIQVLAVLAVRFQTRQFGGSFITCTLGLFGSSSSVGHFTAQGFQTLLAVFLRQVGVLVVVGSRRRRNVLGRLLGRSLAVCGSGDSISTEGGGSGTAEARRFLVEVVAGDFEAECFGQHVEARQSVFGPQRVDFGLQLQQGFMQLCVHGVFLCR
ncbi:hypothetical protein 20Sep420_00009 [Pseudomonas phage 20Sep420]|nr:hypothetical protein 20Sep420_00009 [Pseudomonas phage 20Sep420]